MTDPMAEDKKLRSCELKGCLNAGMIDHAGIYICTMHNVSLEPKLEAYTNSKVIESRIDAAKHINGMLMADEPTILASNRGEDTDATWFKAQLSYSEYLDDEIGGYIADLNKALNHRKER